MGQKLKKREQSTALHRHMCSFSFLFMLIISANDWGCTPSSLAPTEIKSLLLAPELYAKAPVFLEGKVKNSGPAGAWFLLEDATGLIKVTTDKIGYELPCLNNPSGQHISFLGKLESQGETTWIIMEEVRECP